MVQEKKKFVIPEITIIEFSNNDIITISNAGDEVVQGFGGEDYEGE